MKSSKHCMTTHCINPHTHFTECPTKLLNERHYLLCPCSAAVVWEQCDVCFEAALKICLTCMASYCMSHVRDHYRSPDLQTHQLENLQHQGVCDQHHKQHEFFCRTDQSAICSHCLLHNHKEHDVIEQVKSKSNLSHTIIQCTVCNAMVGLLNLMTVCRINEGEYIIIIVYI